MSSSTTKSEVMGTKTGMAHLTIFEGIEIESHLLNSWTKSHRKKLVESLASERSLVSLSPDCKQLFWRTKRSIQELTRNMFPRNHRWTHAFPLLDCKIKSKSKQTLWDFLIRKRFHTKCSSKKTPKDNHESWLFSDFSASKRDQYSKCPP